MSPAIRKKQLAARAFRGARQPTPTRKAGQSTPTPQRIIQTPKADPTKAEQKGIDLLPLLLIFLVLN